MKIFCTSLLLLISISLSLAQNRITIKGIVIDSLDKKPLELSTVAVVNVKDTSLVAYTLTKKTGEFELHNLPAQGAMKLVISYVSYKNYVSTIKVQNSSVIDFGTIALSSKMLGEVIITGERAPIVVKKDTIEFNAEAFKTRPNAMVEELLKKLPGVQVNKDGSITVNGKSVSKVLIDGKEFFGEDLRVATRNLDAAIVSQIQVYDDRQNDPDHLVSETKVPKIINLKLKKAIKRSIFGKVFAGGGTRNRYETAGLFNMFRDTLQLSVIGLSNNLNRTAFSNEELYEQGGFNRAGADNLYNGSVATGGQNWGGGIEKITSGGFNLNTDYGKKLKMNLLYFYSQKQNVSQNSVYQQRFLNDTILLTNANSDNINNAYNHAVSGLLEWNPDTLRNLRYTPKFTINKTNSSSTSLSDNRNNFNDHLNSSSSNALNNGLSHTFQQDFIFNKRFKSQRGASLTINHNLQVNPNQTNAFNNQDLISFVSSLPSDTLRRLMTNKMVNTFGNLNVSYRYPITKKFTVDMISLGSYTKSGEELLTLDQNKKTGIYDILLQNQSTNLKRDLWIENVKPGINYQFAEGISFMANVAGEWQQVANRFTASNLKQNYFYVLPSMRLELKSFSLNYSRSVNQPSISSMQPVTVVYSPLYSTTGNPDLKPSSEDNVSAYYFKYIPDRQIGINLYSNFTASHNVVVTKQTLYANGGQATSYVNRNGQQAVVFGANLGKQFKKKANWQIGLSTMAYSNYNRRLNIINETEGWQNSYSYSVTQNLNVNWKDKVDLSSGGGFRANYTKYNYGDYRKIFTNNWTANNNLTVRWPKKIIWETKQDYVYNSQTASGFQKGIDVVSSSVALQMLKKDKGELKLTVYDIFDQNISVYRYAGNNMVYDVQNNTLKRYFLLTYTIRFNKLSTK